MVTCRDIREVVRTTDMKGDTGQSMNKDVAAERRAWL